MAYTVLDGHKTLLNYPRSTPGTETLESYRSRGGYSTLEAVLKGKYTPEQLLEEVKKSGLRGRGGAGFPTGLKWSFLAKSRPAYLVCNADEGEPGTFKDRVIMEENPHQLVEGMILSLYALRAEHGYIYIRGEYVLSLIHQEGAIREAYAAGYLGENVLGSGLTFHLTPHSGSGAYICGEETGLINSLEGRKGQPRLKPPFPAIIGAFNRPTIVNNVETLAAVCYIAEFGGEAYTQWRNESGKSTGSKLFSVSGHVQNPGVYEVPIGYPFRDLLEKECGGMLRGMALKALIVGGSSVPVVNAETAMKIHMDYESCVQHGTMLGSGGVIVMGEGTCMVRVLDVLLRFYHHESCGQCTPCREGTGWIHRIVRRIENGQGKMEDLDELYRVSDNMEGKTICTLADAAAWPAKSHLKVFREEFEQHIRDQRCPFGNRFPDPFGLGAHA